MLLGQYGSLRTGRPVGKSWKSCGRRSTRTLLPHPNSSNLCKHRIHGEFIMPASNVFKSLVGNTTLAKFTAQLGKLKPAEVNKLRSALLKKFKGLAEYKDANAWARAVAVCEALAVAGWGRKERVDAIAHFNGDCWETYFINAKGEKRFLECRWTKRKKGWQPFNPEYHWSPDRPAVPYTDWREYHPKQSAPVARKDLPSQVNYLRQTPI